MTRVPWPSVTRRPWRRPRWTLCVLVGLSIVLLLVLFGPWSGKKTERDLAAIRAAIRSGEVLTLTVVARDSRLEGFLRGESAESPGPFFETAVPTEDLLTTILEEADGWNRSHPDRAVTVTILPGTREYWVVFLQTLPWILFGGALIWVMWRHNRGLTGIGGAGGFGRPSARLGECERPRVTFADVAGIQEAKEEVYEIIQFLQDPGRFTRLGGRIPRGILLVGSPGTGKTLLAKAVAGEARVPFFSMSGSDFVEMFVGVGASRVRDLFRQARENAPSIVFLDEIDAVGRRRGSALATGSEEREQTLNAILVEMDGFDSELGVIVMAATNRPDVLDPALLRPGRFDREIRVDLPDVKGRREILGVHTAEVPLAEAVNLDEVARGTPTFSGADLEALVNEAALIAALAGREQVGREHLEEARDKVCWGRARHSRILDEDDRRITATHEAGHALLAHLIPEVEPLHKVTIIPRGPALGATLQLPERDRYQLSRATAFGNLLVLYGGRIAESLFCGDISSGAANDMQRASELARRMVCDWGMSDRVGPIVYRGTEDAGSDEPGLVPLGAELRGAIDAEIRRLATDAYAQAEQLLRAHSEDIRELTEALLVRETLNREEVEALISDRVAATHGAPSA